MYLKYCDRRGWKVNINDAPVAEVIGLDRATFTVSGKNAYGMLRAEQGVHRLVRISPTDDKKRRQTSFAGVEVLPVLPEDIEVAIDPNDLRIDVYHASGQGGQGVNTTDSAVSYYTYSNRNGSNLPKRTQPASEQGCSNEYLAQSFV